MKQYLVTWVIDIEANSPEEAAEAALEIQRRADSTATVFDVREDVPGVGPRHHHVDLSPEEES